MKDNEQLAIIEGVGFGNRDVGSPVLFFSTMLSEGTGALQILGGKEALDLIKAYGVYDVKDMDGKPIWVECNGGWGGTIKVTRAWKK